MKVIYYKFSRHNSFEITETHKTFIYNVSTALTTTPIFVITCRNTTNTILGVSTLLLSYLRPNNIIGKVPE